MLQLTRVEWKLLACENGASPDCIIVVVVVEWLYYSERLITVRSADLSELFRWFSSVKCVFLFHVQWKLSLLFGKTWHRKTGCWYSSGKRLIPKQNHGNRQRFRQKSYNNNGKHWKSSKILRVSPSLFFFIFLILHFSTFFFIFFVFHFFHSFIFFNLLSFSFSLLGAQNLIFWGLNFVTISRDNSHVKNQCLGPSISGDVPLWPSFPFFPPFFFSR